MAWCAADYAVSVSNILRVSVIRTIFPSILNLRAEHKPAERRAHFSWKVKLYFYRKELLLTAYRFAPHWISGRYSLDIESLLTGYRAAFTAYFDTDFLPLAKKNFFL